MCAFVPMSISSSLSCPLPWLVKGTQGSSESGIHPASLTPGRDLPRSISYALYEVSAKWYIPMYTAFKFCHYVLACLVRYAVALREVKKIHLTVSLVEAMSCPSVVRILMCLISGAILENTMKSCCLSSCCFSFSHTGVL